MTERWAVPAWIALWQGTDGHYLFNPLNVETLRLDDEAAAVLQALRRQRRGFTAAQAAAAGLGAEQQQLLIAAGCWLPAAGNGHARREYLRSAVADRRRAAGQGAGRTIGAARLVLTQACNLRCDYCFVPTEAPVQMRAETALAAAEWLLQASGGHLEHLQFFGGEPLLRMDLIRAVVDHCTAQVRAGRLQPVRYAITTNGTLVTPAVADFFARHGFTADVSLDGFPPVHDRHRPRVGGGGSFALARRGLRLLQAHGVDAGVLVTPTAESLSGLPDFVRYCAVELGCASVAVNTPQPGPRGWPVDGGQLADALLAARAEAAAAGISFSSVVDRVVAAVDHRQPHDFPCLRGSGSLGVAISPTGGISPCDVAWDGDLLVGRVETGPRPGLAEWKLAPHQVPETCLDCWALPTCGGPCPLDLYYNPDDARTNRERCAFFRAVTRWAVCRPEVRV